MVKAMVLLSGGLDSAVALAIAADKYGADNVSAVSCLYGQKHVKELECAKKLAEYYDVPHYELDLTPVMKYSNCSLLSSSSKDIEYGSYEEQKSRDENGKVSTYVPFRNGLFLSALAALAMSIYPNDKVVLYIGAHADDAAGNAYADCSYDFLYAMNEAIHIGTYNQVTVCAPFIAGMSSMTKADVVATGLKLKVPFELTWSCYEGGDKPCGKCGTCIDRAKAFELNGVKDPAIKEDD